MKSVPTIQKYMTFTPHTIGSDQPISKAEKVMGENHIRHLPVLEGSRLVGIISERDIKVVESFKSVDPEKVKVAEALTQDPFTVSPNAPLTDVCAEMAAHKYGSVLVVDNNKLVGIFTWVDALKAMTELMNTRLKH